MRPLGFAMDSRLDEVTYIKNWDKGVKYLADGAIFLYRVMP
jgi:predicted AAA+ superfamily ATPase